MFAKLYNFHVAQLIYIKLLGKAANFPLSCGTL